MLRSALARGGARLRWTRPRPSLSPAQRPRACVQRSDYQRARLTVGNGSAEDVVPLATRRRPGTQRRARGAGRSAGEDRLRVVGTGSPASSICVRRSAGAATQSGDRWPRHATGASRREPGGPVCASAFPAATSDQGHADELGLGPPTCSGISPGDGSSRSDGASRSPGAGGATSAAGTPSDGRSTRCPGRPACGERPRCCPSGPRALRRRSPRWRPAAAMPRN